MKIKIYAAMTILTSMLSMQAAANDLKERIYLTQIINQLNAIKPLIIAANKEQEKNLRIRFHYTTYRDSNEKLHNGLLEDINDIQNGIQAKLNLTSGEIRHFQPVKDDYISLNTMRSNTAEKIMGKQHVKR